MSGRADLLRAFARRRLAMVALLFLIVAAFAAAAADLTAPYPPLKQRLEDVMLLPSPQHLLGTDTLGRDILSRLMFAGRSAIAGVVAGVAAFVLVGVPTGLAAGFFGSWVDRVLSAIVDVALSIPGIILVLVVISIFYGNEIAPMIALGALASTSVMRVVRSATLAVRGELFVDAARVSGLDEWRILLRHVLPRVVGPIIVQATLFSGGALLIQAGIGFLGFGPPPPNPSLGQMVADGALQLSRDPWLLIPAGLAITVTVVSLGIVGDAIRDINAERWSGGAGTLRPLSVVAAVGREPLAAADASAALSVRGLSVAFAGRGGDVPVLQRVSFDVYPGEVVGLVGESGSGKTITALALLGLLPRGAHVTDGSCTFGGRDVFTMRPGERATLRGSHIAMISQEPSLALDPAFTVGNTLTEVVRRHEPMRAGAARSRAAELVQMVGLEETIARRYPHELSGGMAQRVAIAVALAGRPKLLIADEPTTALDVTTQAEILELLRQLQGQNGLAILFVTHDWGVVADLCQRAVVMYAGQVVEYAALGEIMDRPLHPYTEGLLLSDPARATPGAPLAAIPGTVAQPRDWPVGCRFAPRCRYADDTCRGRAIDLAEPSTRHFSRCVHIDRLLAASA